MKTIHVAIQASSTSWMGGRDICMNPIDGQPVIYWTIRNVLENFGDVSVTIVAPGFDKDGELNDIASQFRDKGVKITYGYDDSPLERLIAAFSSLQDDAHILRVDGLNFAFNPANAKAMYAMAVGESLDCVKFPDDFPIQFTFDVYRIGALKKVKSMLTDADSVYKVHPKYYMITRPTSFKFKYYETPAAYSDAELTKYRNSYKNVFEARQGGTKHRLSVGDQLNYHYEIAAEYLDRNMEVLDIASGEGYGAVILASKSKAVKGCDYDEKTIGIAQDLHKKVDNLKFTVENALATTFEDGQFDMITSMETIEHVPDENAYMVEMRRILKKGGIFIFSTPQNRMGHIPMNNEHVIEYTLDAVVSLAKKYFTVERVLGIKQGKIIIPDSPLGTNTMVFCRKK